MGGFRVVLESLAPLATSTTRRRRRLSTWSTATRGFPGPRAKSCTWRSKQRGVPTEFFVYPGNTHGIPDARNQYLKAVAEFAWFEKWIRGKPWFTWKELLKAVDDSTAAAGRVAGN